MHKFNTFFGIFPGFVSENHVNQEQFTCERISVSGYNFIAGLLSGCPAMGNGRFASVCNPALAQRCSEPPIESAIGCPTNAQSCKKPESTKSLSAFASNQACTT